MPGLGRSVARGRRAIGLAAMVYRERGSSPRPPEGVPSLRLDFVPTAGTDGLSLDLNFISQSYASFQPDPQTGGLTLFQVWS